MTPPPVPPPGSYDGGVAAACRYERGLAVKALIALAVVAVLIVMRILWF
ncbi:MAG TPA: hypothetical protein VK586_05910 [Streptosporangiaceae bacterium]|nr:hypothetical protein [Streptosporangiaceae bacterium]